MADVKEALMTDVRGHLWLIRISKKCHEEAMV
jgi:hypothetical protein